MKFKSTAKACVRADWQFDNQVTLTISASREPGSLSITPKDYERVAKRLRRAFRSPVIKRWPFGAVTVTQSFHNADKQKFSVTMIFAQPVPERQRLELVGRPIVQRLDELRAGPWVVRKINQRRGHHPEPTTYLGFGADTTEAGSRNA